VLQLRVKDIDFDRRQIRPRRQRPERPGIGPLTAGGIDSLPTQRRRDYEGDRRRFCGDVSPRLSEIPKRPQEWAWQYVFRVTPVYRTVDREDAASPSP
jgi:hypothetical protein